MSEDEDIPQLSAETFAALQVFYKEQEMLNVGEIDGNSNFEENWVCILNIYFIFCNRFDNIIEFFAKIFLICASKYKGEVTGTPKCKKNIF